MKITYEIDTCSENYDSHEAARLAKSLDMALALWDISQIWLKQERSEKELTFDDATKAIGEIFEDYNINPDELSQ